MKYGARANGARSRVARSVGLLATMPALLALACQSSSPAPTLATSSQVRAPSMSVQGLDERALLMLLADREIYDSFSVNKALEADTALRLELARVLGRVSQPQGRVVLERLLADQNPEVRREAAFALGESDEPLSQRVLLQMAVHADRETGRLAVEALAKRGTDFDQVQRAIADLGDVERRARLLPSLYRFDSAETLLLAARWLETGDPEERTWAVYALSRNAVAEAAPWLRDLLVDPDPWVRGWAARGLGSVGDGSDLARLQPLLEDDQAGPRIQALRAATRLISRGEAAPLPGWKPKLLALAEDSRPGVRHAALAASEAWLLDPDLSAVLIERWQTGSPRERQLALLALARGGDPRATDLTRRALTSLDPQIRRTAAQAAGILGEETLLALLASDDHPAVRADVFSALFEREDAAEMQFAEAALVDTSAAVRTVALGWLEEHPVLPLASLGVALAPSDEVDRTDLESALVGALMALAGKEGSPVEEIAVVLDQLAREGSFVVRRAAVAGLGELGVEAPPVGPAEATRDLAAYREIVQRTASARRLDMVTSRGVIRLRLDCPDAPLTCLSFLQLSEQGFFDDLPFHRVVPDFVVQGGDPSGGGWGGPGYNLRDEINRIRFDAGVIGMAHGGPDTAGSQFFITLSRQPHLDGGYTAFGRVESGWETLMAIEQEDRILQIREVGQGAP